MLEHHYHELLNYLLRITGNRDTAADIAQEAFVRVLEAQAAKPETQIREPRAWLFKTAKNIVIDRYRQETVRGYDNVDEIGLLASEACDPVTVIAGQQAAEAVLQIITQLPPRCKEAFVLYKLVGLPQATIAVRMGISANMVEKHINTGMLACKNCPYARED